MTTSTDGQICYGILFEEDYEFPWDIKHDGDIDEWWLEIKKFKPTIYPFDKHGEYGTGIGSDYPEIAQYYKERSDWIKKNPLPITLVNYCSSDYPMYILAYPESVITVSRGHPRSLSSHLNLDSIYINVDDNIRLKKFVKDYGIKTSGEKPRWWLSSYWG